MRRMKVFINIHVLLFLGFYLFAASNLNAAKEEEEIWFGYKFKPGSSQDFKIEFSQEFEVKGYSFFSLFDMEYTEKCVASVDDTLFKMEITFNKVSASSKRNDELRDVEIDDHMLNQTFTFDINGNGIISDVQSAGYVEEEDEVLNVLNMVLIASYPYLPDSVMTINEEWSFEGSTLRDVKSDLDIESTSNFKVEGMKKEKGRKCATIKEEMETYLYGRIENESGKFILDGQGEGKAEYLFDIEHLSVIKMKYQVEVEVTSVDASDTAAAAREVYTSNIVYNVKKKLK